MGDAVGFQPRARRSASSASALGTWSQMATATTTPSQVVSKTSTSASLRTINTSWRYSSMGTTSMGTPAPMA